MSKKRQFVDNQVDEGVSKYYEKRVRTDIVSANVVIKHNNPLHVTTQDDLFRVVMDRFKNVAGVKVEYNIPFDSVNIFIDNLGEE